MPVQQGASKVKTFSMVVQDDTQPMYMYCAAAKQYVFHTFYIYLFHFPPSHVLHWRQNLLILSEKQLSARNGHDNQRVSLPSLMLTSIIVTNL